VDGFSIGSNDLTQLVLGADRDSNILAAMGYFDERDPAVLKAISMIIRGAHKKGATVSICGQAPSVYPEIVEFLVKEGIDSISVNPDAVIPTRRLVASIERKLMLERLTTIIEKLNNIKL
ncbi:MAG: putative PEP-binding protein, partial [Desulfurococcaceae archaeon]